jgi:hypothetical protein
MMKNQTPSTLRDTGRSFERERYLTILLKTIWAEAPRIRFGEDFEWQKDFEPFRDRATGARSKSVQISFRRKDNTSTPGNRWPHILCSAGVIAGDARYLIRDANNRLGDNLLDHNSLTHIGSDFKQPIPQQEWDLLIQILTAAEPKMRAVEEGKVGSPPTPEEKPHQPRYDVLSILEMATSTIRTSPRLCGRWTLGPNHPSADVHWYRSYRFLHLEVIYSEYKEDDHVRRILRIRAGERTDESRTIATGVSWDDYLAQQEDGRPDHIHTGQPLLCGAVHRYPDEKEQKALKEVLALAQERAYRCRLAERPGFRFL